MVAVAKRNRGFVVLDPALHLLEQFVDQPRVGLHRRFEIRVLRFQIGQDFGIAHLGVARIAKPRPWVLDRHAVALETVGTLRGSRRGREIGEMVTHAPGS
jgi:hypothetical protein